MKFSERIGKTQIKTGIQLEAMDDDLKIALWNIYDLFYLHDLKHSQTLYDTGFVSLYNNLWHNFFKKPLDTIPNINSTLIEEIRHWFFNCQWFEVYDFIEHIAKIESSVDNDSFKENCNNMCIRELSGYRFVGENITAITDETEIKEIEEAIEMAMATKLTGVYEHLKTALNMLSDRKNPDYRNSVKESISAVESLAQIIADKSAATLGEALKIIENKTDLHGALKKAFMSIYGYTSDEDGIRHAMLKESKVDFEDAKYMIVSCSAFINYLIVKADNAGIKI